MKDEGERGKGLRGVAAAWVISAAIHGAVVVGAFFVVWNVTLPEGRDVTPAIVYFDDPGLRPEEAGEQDDRPAALLHAAEEKKPMVIEARDLPAIEEVLAGLGEIEPPALMRKDGLAGAPLLDTGRHPEVRFAGLGASEASSVVYVVDASGSMVSTLPIVTRELERSIRRLAPTQQFQVIFFTGAAGMSGYVAAPHPADSDARVTRLVRALPENVDAVVEWIRSVGASGRSNPILAIEVGLSLRPDAIFVLSSELAGFGAWEPDRDEVLAELDRLNPCDRRTGVRPTTIKTVQFLELDSSGILEAIGRLHGGTDGHRLMTREELNIR